MSQQESIWNYRYKALASKVLVVAVIHKIQNEWACYIDAVPGMKHDEEYKKVGHCGTIVDNRIAEILFPNIFQKYTYVRGW